MNVEVKKTLANSKPDKFNFSVDSALLGELGEKLVSSVHVALSELVKNAYDADAKLVTLSILPEGLSTRIVIDDDGIGMTLGEVKSYWMRIGTTNKVDQPISKTFGRLRTGAKGVGRFACRRLGLNLKLTTTARIKSTSNSTRSSTREKYQTTIITFDWEKFTPGITVEEIISEGNTSTAISGATGTRLEIWGARKNEWSKLGFNYIQRQLGILTTNRGIKRRGFDEDPGFNVHLKTPFCDGQLVDLRKDIIEAGWGTITAHVDKQGHAICTLSALGIGGQKQIISKLRFKEIAGASLSVGIFPANTKKEFRNPSILSKQSAQEIVNDWGGVHVRYNDFRVYPYGDEEDDWLKIDADRSRRLGKPTEDELFQFAATLQGVEPGRSILNMLSQRSYLGQVEVSSKISGLVPRLDRQGFVDGVAFDKLKKFVRFAIEWANIYREFYIRTRVEEDASFALEAVQSVLHEEVDKAQLVPKVASYLRKEIKKIVQYLPEEAQKRTEQSLLTTLRAIETNNEANIRQLEHLRLIASASTLTLLFAHEARTLIGSLGATSKRLKRIATKSDDKNREELNTLATQIDAAKSRFDNLVEMTGIVGAFGKQKEMQSIHLQSAIERAVRCFSLVLDGYNIHVNVSDIPGDMTVGPMIEGEVYTVLINLLSNSIKSLIASGQPLKQIHFGASQKDTKAIINMLDNGVGLSQSNYEEVFKPFISDPDGTLYDQLEQMANPQDAHIFGTGSGLGLAITRDIVRARKGDISFQLPPTGWSASMEIKLPCQQKN